MSGTKGASGGARVGAGRKAKGERARWLSGGADKRGPKPATVPEPAPVASVDVPAGLTPAELAAWLVTAPHALAARTLTPATADDFTALCALEVEMAAVLTERRAEGWTARGLALAKEYRGLVQRVEAKRRAFKLAPMGKEMVAADPPKDEWAEFDEAPQTTTEDRTKH